MASWIPSSTIPDGTGGDLLGGLEDLEQVLMRTAVDEVFIALPIKSRYTEIQQVMWSLRASRREGEVSGRSVRGHRDCVSEVEDDRVGAGRDAPRSRGLAAAG